MDHLSAVLNNSPWQVRGISPLAVTSDLTELVRLQTQTDTEGSDPFCCVLGIRALRNYRTVSWGNSKNISNSVSNRS